MKREREPPLDVTRICVQLKDCAGNKTIWRCVEIPSSDLEPFYDHDERVYCRHDHVHGDPSQFVTVKSRVLCESTPVWASRTVILGSTLYTFDWRANELLYLSLDHDAKPDSPFWQAIPKARSFFLWFEPIPLVSNDKVYFFGVCFTRSGIAIEYDPQYRILKEIEMPSEWNSKDNSGVFVGSLDSGSILMADPLTYLRELPSKEKKYQRCYDVSKGTWKSFEATGFLDRAIDISGTVVSAWKENMFYWVDNSGFFYTYSWKENKFACGPIVGVEHELLLWRLKRRGFCFPLFRLNDELICFPWLDYDQEADNTHLHLSVAVLKNRSDYSHTVFVVGCFTETFPAILRLEDAFAM